VSYLLIRGLAREGAHWFDFPDALAARSGARVERVDVAGCGTQRGRAPVPSVPWLARDVAGRFRQLASSAPGSRWVIIGLSLGGMITLELCRLLPGCFERAVIINASSRLTPIGERLRPRGGLTLLRALGSSDALARERNVLAITSSLPSASRERYAERAASIAAERPPSRVSVLAQLVGAAGFVPPPRNALSVPLTFVCSRRDRLVSPRCTRDLAAFYSGAVLEHPWAGHDLPLDDPDWLCERLVTMVTPTPHH
jgi:pimeloyl-ACP methyl ester carboxylesterase